MEMGHHPKNPKCSGKAVTNGPVYNGQKRSNWILAYSQREYFPVASKSELSKIEPS